MPRKVANANAQVMFEKQVAQVTETKPILHLLIDRDRATAIGDFRKRDYLIAFGFRQFRFRRRRHIRRRTAL